MQNKFKSTFKILGAFLALGFFILSFIYVQQLSHRTIIEAPYQHTILKIPSTLDSEIKFYEKAIKKNPDGQIVHATLADLYSRKAKFYDVYTLFQKAEATAKKSLAILEYKNEKAKLVLADIAQVRHAFQESIAICNDVLQSPTLGKANLTKALSLLVTSHLAYGNLAAARDAATRLIAVQPSTTAYVQRALVAEATGQVADAHSYFTKAYAVETFGDVAEASRFRSLWGRLHMRYGNFLAANNLFQEAIRVNSEDSLALGYLAELQIKQNNYAESVRLFSKAYALSNRVTHLLGQLQALRLINNQKAVSELHLKIDSLVTAELKQPDAFAHRSERIRFLLDRGSTDDISQALKLAIDDEKIRPNAEAKFLLAQAYLKSNQLNLAKQIINSALDTGVKEYKYFHLATEVEEKNRNIISRYLLLLRYLSKSHFG